MKLLEVRKKRSNLLFREITKSKPALCQGCAPVYKSAK